MAKKSLFKDRAKELKKLGLVNYDLRKNPTDYQKRRARELYDQYRAIIKRPEDFTVKVVNKETADRIDTWKRKTTTKSGKVKLWINNEGGKKVKITRDGKVEYRDEKFSSVEKRYKGGKDIFKSAKKVFAEVEKLNKGRKGKDKVYVTVNIGGNMPFSRVFGSLAQFEWYFNRWMPQDAEDDEEGEELKEQLMMHFNLTVISRPGGQMADADTGHVKPKKAKQKISRHRL